MTAHPGPDEAFPVHVFELFGVTPTILDHRIGGMVMVAKKKPEHGPITLITAGASKLATESGERVELAVEVLAGQEEAGMIALEIVCDDIHENRRVPPPLAPWRNGTPFLTDTAISALLATPSRWGPEFDEVRDGDGALVGHVVTLRMLTDAEAEAVSQRGWDDVRDAIGLDGLLDVERPETPVP